MTAALSSRIDLPSERPVVPTWRGVEEVPAEFGRCLVVLGVFDGLHRSQRRLVDHEPAR